MIYYKEWIDTGRCYVNKCDLGEIVIYGEEDDGEFAGWSAKVAKMQLAKKEHSFEQAVEKIKFYLENRPSL